MLFACVSTKQYLDLRCIIINLLCIFHNFMANFVYLEPISLDKLTKNLGITIVCINIQLYDLIFKCKQIKLMFKLNCLLLKLRQHNNYREINLW